MKKAPYLLGLCVGVLLLGGTETARSQADAPPRKKQKPSATDPFTMPEKEGLIEEQWLVAAEVFTLPMKEALDVLAQHQDDASIYRAFTAAATERPEVREKLLLLRQARNRGTLHEVDEWHYATEFDPQEVPQQLMLGDGHLLEALANLVEQDDSTPKPTPQQAPSPSAPVVPAPLAPSAPASPAAQKSRHPANGGLTIISQITPTAFEMRPCGWLMEMDVVPTDQAGLLDLNVSLENVIYRHDVFYNGEPQPLFASRKIQTSTRLRDGIPALLGTLHPSRNSGVRGTEGPSEISVAFLTARRAPSAKGQQMSRLEEQDQRVRFEAYSLPANEAVKLWQTGALDADLRGKLRDQVKRGGAKLEVLLTGIDRRSLEKIVLQQGQEYRYPTEFDPPETPQQLYIADEALLSDLRAGRQTGTGISPPDGSFHNGGFGLVTIATPTAFEMRHLGDKLTVEYDVEEGTILAKIEAERVRLLGTRSVQGLEQPSFETQSMVRNVVLSPGVPCFLGTMSPPQKTGVKGSNTEDRVWMAFLTMGGN